jgi:alpha-D-xyloside xylohydrolase
MELRERLRPYIQEQMATAHREGIPPMRPLFMEFPNDPHAWNIEDQFLLGPDILIAPVTSLGMRERVVYLPAGARWTDAWTGTEHDGGATHLASAPLDKIPVFLRKADLRPLFQNPS